MTSTGHVTPLGDRLSGSLSPSHMVDVEKNGANDTIKPHDDAAKVMQAGPVSQTMFGEKREQYRSEEEYMYEQQKRSEGDHKFHRLGWKKLTICLLVEAIALVYVKSIWALGIIEIIIYTLTSALIYTFVGTNVQSPALLSAGTSLSKVAFSIALPMIFISGSINTTVVVQYIHSHIFKNSVIRYINTTMGWVTWLGLVALITVIAWVITKAIPFFSNTPWHHVSAVHLGLHLLLPGLDVVPAYQGGQVECDVLEHDSQHHECLCLHSGPGHSATTDQRSITFASLVPRISCPAHRMQSSRESSSSLAIPLPFRLHHMHMPAMRVCPAQSCLRHHETSSSARCASSLLYLLQAAASVPAPPASPADAPLQPGSVTTLPGRGPTVWQQTRADERAHKDRTEFEGRVGQALDRELNDDKRLEEALLGKEEELNLDQLKKASKPRPVVGQDARRQV
ncbi:hypothetical protein [Sporisorium scitamineum]|uniref:Amino acid transporter transmembrane domain-containing protein n=1 Tax=Sporisorium scitamineum TaxID=49012 RepID=A0A0F7S511_9BASI|nr:hypothetical protein [Sporisorium scitamineum]